MSERKTRKSFKATFLGVSVELSGDVNLPPDDFDGDWIATDDSNVSDESYVLHVWKPSDGNGGKGKLWKAELDGPWISGSFIANGKTPRKALRALEELVLLEMTLLAKAIVKYTSKIDVQVR